MQDQQQPAPAPPQDTDALEELIGANEAREQALALWEWARTELWSIDVAIQFALVAAALVVAALIGPLLKKLIARHLEPRAAAGVLKRTVSALRYLGAPITAFIALHAISFGARSGGLGTAWIEAAISLLTAWIVIRMVTLVIRSAVWSRVVFFVAWPIAALDILGLLGPLIDYLDGAALAFGQGDDAFRLSALTIARAVVAFAVLLWAASQLSSFLEKRIYKIGELTPSLQVLVIQSLKIVLPVLAFVFALGLVGVDLTAFTVLGGAIGIGIGLGLQRSVANLVAGFQMIMDKSIKPGDVIAINDTFGWVTSLGARYVAVRTRDGTEHLVPNEQFTMLGVENWSHRDRAIRVKATVGVSYKADVPKAIALCIEAAQETPRVLTDPRPICLLKAFGDSSIDLEARFWISDPENGVGNIRGAVLLKIWEKFQAAGVEIPFPQRDIHIVSQPGGGASATMRQS